MADSLEPNDEGGFDIMINEGGLGGWELLAEWEKASKVN